MIDRDRLYSKLYKIYQKKIQLMKLEIEEKFHDCYFQTRFSWIKNQSINHLYARVVVAQTTRYSAILFGGFPEFVFFPDSATMLEPGCRQYTMNFDSKHPNVNFLQLPWRLNGYVVVPRHVAVMRSVLDYCPHTLLPSIAQKLFIETYQISIELDHMLFDGVVS